MLKTVRAPRILTGGAGRLARWMAVLGGLCWCPPARGQALNETGPSHIEYAMVPLVGGDSDIGVGAGALGSMARLSPGRHLYTWRLEGMAFATIKPAGGLDSPYQDAFLLLTVTSLFGTRARFELRPSFTRENNLRYHGLGNASVAAPSDVPARDFFRRTHPALLVKVRLPVAGQLHAVLGTLYTHSFIAYSPQSNLARDLATGSPRVQDLLHVDTNHGLHLLEAGLLFDTRDHEIDPAAGQLHSVKARVSPWGIGYLPDRYVQLNATARAYLTLWRERLVIAGRLIGDLQVGDPPFYELSRYDETSAVGGANGVRGVPGDRYYGKRKLFGNLELRAVVANFHLWDSQYALGTTAFVDGGRVWADLTSAPELDGTGVGLKYGIGGGLRLRKGETFVLRADLAWSPDARPIGFYFLAGHIF